MNVLGKITMFVEKREGKNGNNWQSYSGSISHKNQDGTYINAKIDIEFDNGFSNKEKLTQLKEKTAYQMDVKEGWLDAKCWEYEGKKQYRIILHIKEAVLLSAKEVANNSNGLPF